MKNRIAAVISEARITKAEFAKRIEVSQPFVSQMCSGAANPSARTIANICREFHIRREWLENGEGPMRHPEPEDDMDFINALLAGDDAETIRFIKKFLRTYTTLPAEDQRVIDNLIHTLLSEK